MWITDTWVTSTKNFRPFKQVQMAFRWAESEVLVYNRKCKITLFFVQFPIIYWKLRFQMQTTIQFFYLLATPKFWTVFLSHLLVFMTKGCFFSQIHAYNPWVWHILRQGASIVLKVLSGDPKPGRKSVLSQSRAPALTRAASHWPPIASRQSWARPPNCLLSHEHTSPAANLLRLSPTERQIPHYAPTQELPQHLTPFSLSKTIAFHSEI